MRSELVSRIETPGWVNLRTGLGAALFLIAMASGSRVLGGADPGVAVWAVTRDLAAGTRLTASDVRSTRVDLAAEHLSRYVSAEASVSGALLVRATQEGELLAAGAVARPGTPTDGRSITIPVSAEHAVGGRLSAGDVVDVLVTVDARGAAARTTLLVGSAVVQDVVSDPAFGNGDAALVGITVTVDPAEALRIALATRSAEIDVVRVDGASTQRDGPPGAPSSLSLRQL